MPILAYIAKKNMSEDQKNILSFSQYLANREKTHQKVAGEGPLFEGGLKEELREKKGGELLILLPKTKQKKDWKKQVLFYGQEASHVIAMAFVFIFLFVFALHFDNSKQKRGIASGIQEKALTEKDYIKEFKKREKVKSAGATSPLLEQP